MKIPGTSPISPRICAPLHIPKTGFFSFTSSLIPSITGVMDAIAGRSTGLVSGMERDVGGEVIASHLTTPESLEMQQLQLLYQQMVLQK